MYQANLHEKHIFSFDNAGIYVVAAAAGAALLIQLQREKLMAFFCVFHFKRNEYTLLYWIKHTVFHATVQLNHRERKHNAIRIERCTDIANIAHLIKMAKMTRVTHDDE